MITINKSSIEQFYLLPAEYKTHLKAEVHQNGETKSLLDREGRFKKKVKRKQKELY